MTAALALSSAKTKNKGNREDESILKANNGAAEVAAVLHKQAKQMLNTPASNSAIRPNIGKLSSGVVLDLCELTHHRLVN